MWVMSTAGFCSATAPTITMPPISSVLGSLLYFSAYLARPLVPPLPPMFSYSTWSAAPAATMAAPRARPVWSQPPPALAGITMRTVPASLAALAAAGAGRAAPAALCAQAEGPSVVQARAVATDWAMAWRRSMAADMESPLTSGEAGKASGIRYSGRCKSALSVSFARCHAEATPSAGGVCAGKDLHTTTWAARNGRQPSCQSAVAGIRVNAGLGRHP